jgi:PAS domain S-box-containing protein
MTNLSQHRLLRRQLKKHKISDDVLEVIQPLLDSINDAYHSNETDIGHLENIIEKSSQELYKANQLLKKDIKTKSDELDIALKRYDIVASNIKEILFLLDPKGNFLYLNKAWEDLTGEKNEQTYGKSFLTLKDKLTNQSERAVDKILMNSLSEVNDTIEYLNRDGSREWFELTGRKIYDDKGVLEGTIGTMVNITQIKKTEFDLTKSKEDAEKANKAKDEFLSTMSHEIRTPLNAIVGISNLLLMNETLPDQIENLDALKFSSEHLLNLINDILDFSKIESGKIEFDDSEFSIHDLLLGIRKNYSYPADEKGISFKVKKDEELPEVLIGDMTRLSQIISNLVSNAIKFTSQGNVILDVEVIKSSKTSVRLKFEIKDSGIGIMQSKIDKIFEKFSQASSDTTKLYGGTGLGLPICKKLLELQGSQLYVSSVFGEGSTFWFELDFGVSERFTAPTSKLIDLKPSFGAIIGLKVLVAEDNQLNIMVVKQFLSKWGLDFKIVLDGKQAIEAVEAEDFDLILMDLQMPVMNGYQATLAIRAKGGKYQTMPILALTASTTISVRKEAEDAGMDDYIMKPFNPKDLYQVLKYYKEKIAETAEI